MNTKQIKEIQKIIDNHRKDMFTTCVETCPCWDFQMIIDRWEEKNKRS